MTTLPFARMSELNDEKPMDDTENLLREVQRRQRDTIQRNDETTEQYDIRMAAHYALFDEWIGTFFYNGNSVGWSYSKAENYKRALLEAWGALNKLGIKADGNTTVTQAIERFCVKKD